MLQEASKSISGWLIRTLKVRFNREAEGQKVAQYRRHILNPIMKELERAMAYHPRTKVPYEVTKSPHTSRLHAQNARAMLAHELKCHRLYSPQGNQLIHQLDSLPALSSMTN
jgi:hypothetical protein